MDAPTPRAFAEKYDLAPASARSTRHIADLEDCCQDRLIEVGEGGTFLKVHAKSEDPAIVHWGFDYLIKKLSGGWSKPPHLIVAHGAQWSRDSLRDYKVVGGKVIQLASDDPDIEEEGIG